MAQASATLAFHEFCRLVEILLAGQIDRSSTMCVSLMRICPMSKEDNRA